MHAQYGGLWHTVSIMKGEEASDHCGEAGMHVTSDHLEVKLGSTPHWGATSLSAVVEGPCHWHGLSCGLCTGETWFVSRGQMRCLPLV